MNDIVCISPIDGSEVARRPIATDAEIAAALAQARRAQQDWQPVVAGYDPGPDGGDRYRIHESL